MFLTTFFFGVITMQIRMLVGSSFTYTLPTGATIVSSIPGCVTVSVAAGVATFTAVALGGSRMALTLAAGVTFDFVIAVIA